MNTMRVIVTSMVGVLFSGITIAGAQAPPETSTAQALTPSLIEQATDLAAAAVPPAPDDGKSEGAEATQAPEQPAWAAEGRACEGCPRRSVGRALLQTTIVNGFYELGNLLRGEETARLTPKTWWANMKQGWEWDLNDFAVNQIGHPYQGNNYFTTGRANGLGFYESAAVAAFGSGTWEYFGETAFPSLNDFINTTLGGIALGEMFHRTAWLVRDTQATGRRRLWREIGATVIDPITGANRFLRGDASRVSEKPSDMVPSDLTGLAAAGVLWRGTEGNSFTAAGQPFLEVDGIYGEPNRGRSRTPYDAFSVRLRFGGGSAFSEARVRGRLLSQAFRNDTVQFAVVQSYDYQKNDAYSTGSQSFDAALGFTRRLSSRTSLWVLGWGGLTVLGAVDSLPLGVIERPDRDPEEGGPRYYDYGPGSNFGVTANFLRNGRPFAGFSYEGRHLYSLDGVRANHFLQRGRFDVLLPLRGSLGVGLSGEYFDRRTFFQDPQRTLTVFHYPQVRAYFTWSVS